MTSDHDELAVPAGEPDEQHTFAPFGRDDPRTRLITTADQLVLIEA